MLESNILYACHVSTNSRLPIIFVITCFGCQSTWTSEEECIQSLRIAHMLVRMRLTCDARGLICDGNATKCKGRYTCIPDLLSFCPAQTDSCRCSHLSSSAVLTGLPPVGFVFFFSDSYSLTLKNSKEAGLLSFSCCIFFQETTVILRLSLEETRKKSECSYLAIEPMTFRLLVRKLTRSKLGKNPRSPYWESNPRPYYC